MLRSMLSIEHTKTMKQSIVWIEIIAIALIVGGLMALLFGVSRIPMPDEVNATGQVDQMVSTVTWPGAFLNALEMSSGTGVGSIFVVILAGALVAQEFQNKTLHLWLSRGVPRFTYILARFTSLLLPMFLLVLAALAMGSLVSMFFTLFADGTLHLDKLNVGQLALSILRTLYTLLPYAALAFLLAIVSRSAVVAIGIGLSFSLLVESLTMQLLVMFGGAAAQMVKFLPGVMAKVVLQENQALINTAVNAAQPAGDAMIPTLPLPASVIGIALYTLAFIALAGWSLYKKDLTA